MGEWGWVVAGYGLVYGTLLGYAAWLIRRLRRVRRDLDEAGDR